MLRLTRKADRSVHASDQLHLPPREIELAASLVGVSIRKLRHRLRSIIPGVKISVDEFQAVLAEAEFESADALAAFAAPPFEVLREVTSDLRHGRNARA